MAAMGSITTPRRICGMMDIMPAASAAGDVRKQISERPGPLPGRGRESRHKAGRAKRHSRLCANQKPGERFAPIENVTCTAWRGSSRYVKNSQRLLPEAKGSMAKRRALRVVSGRQDAR